MLILTQWLSSESPASSALYHSALLSLLNSSSDKQSSLETFTAPVSFETSCLHAFFFTFLPPLQYLPVHLAILMYWWGINKSYDQHPNNKPLNILSLWLYPLSDKVLMSVVNVTKKSSCWWEWKNYHCLCQTRNLFFCTLAEQRCYFL